MKQRQPLTLSALQSVWVRTKDRCCGHSRGQEKDCPERAMRAPLFLILSGLQQGQESCWHFSISAQWVHNDEEASVCICGSLYGSECVCLIPYYICTQNPRKNIFLFFYLIHCGFFLNQLSNGPNMLSCVENVFSLKTQTLGFVNLSDNAPAVD